MRQGSRVRGILGTAGIGLAALLATQSYAGIEIGNGGFLDLDADGAKSVMEKFEAVGKEVGDKAVIFYAPKSDPGYPPTFLRFQSLLTISTAEEAMKLFQIFNKGWKGFVRDTMYAFQRERAFANPKGWSRFDMQYFYKDRNYVISLEGEKRNSPAYGNTAKSLLHAVAAR